MAGVVADPCKMLMESGGHRQPRTFLEVLWIILLMAEAAASCTRVKTKLTFVVFRQELKLKTEV